MNLGTNHGFGKDHLMINIKYKIILAFSSIVLLLAAMGSFLIQSMESLAKETKNIYRHPFAVSNATRDIRIHLLSVQVIETGNKWPGNIKRRFSETEFRWINQTIHSVYDDHYKLSSYSHIISDVTDKKALEELSVTDTLTTLLNRRAFDDVIEEEIRTARRRDSFLTLAMMDIDFFKR